MTTTVAAGLQAMAATVYHSGELVKSGWQGRVAGSGPTSTYLSRSAWRTNNPRKQLVRRLTRCEASGKGFHGLAEEARRSAGEAGRAFGRKADQVFDGVQDKAQRAAQIANSKVEEIVQRLGIEEPLSLHLAKKGNEIRSEMVGTAESVYNSTLAISSRPVVRRSIIGFLLFYAFSVVWAARILFFDKKSEEARERFGRELRLQKLREGGVSASMARAPLDHTEIEVNGRKVPSASDEGFLDKVRKIQEMARAVRVSEQEVFSPSESGFVSISDTGPIPESEKQQSSIPSDKKDLQKKKMPSNGNVTPSFNGAARPVTPVASRPQTFKSMRVITSPEEARARIAARKAKDGYSSAKTSSSRPTKFPRINVPDVESVASDLGTDSDQSIDQVGSEEKDKGDVRGVDSQSSKRNRADSKSSSSPRRERKQEPKSAEQEEEEAWMRDEVLRNIVLKVQDNEDAGRESFHGLDSKEEQRFFQGLERKFDREGEAVKNWIQDRVENLDYGIGGVGVDDPPESFVARWKDDDDPERAKRFAKFQEDRKGILEKQMGISTPAQTPDHTSGAPTSSSPSPASEPSQSTGRRSSASTSSPFAPAPAPTKDRIKTDEAKERLQSNGNASGSKTIVTSSGRQAKPVAREWQHTKKWAQDLQRKYDLEPDSEKRALIDEVGQDLDRWITEDEIEEASRLLSQGLPGEQEYVRMHYEKTKEKIQKQHEMFGSEGMLNKYAEYKEPKKEPELWWLDLPYVLCVGLTTSAEDGNSNAGFYSLDMTPDFAGMLEGPTATCNHTVAFQDQKDALNFCGLLLSEQYSADVIPIAPKDLYQDAKQQGFKVTVIKKGQLGLSPGQALDDVEQRLIDIGSSIYWEELERARSIDIDAVLDEGLGYGRPSR